MLGGENFRCVLFVDGRRREGESCVDRERIFFSFYSSIFYLSLFVVFTRKRLEGFSIDKFRFGEKFRKIGIHFWKLFQVSFFPFCCYSNFVFFKERSRLIISSNRFILINYEKHSNIFFFISEINFILKRRSFNYLNLIFDQKAIIV